MRRTTYFTAFIVTVLLALASPASASPMTIGLFTYDIDFFGPFFTVHNDSNLTTPGSFTDTTVELFDSATSVYSTNLGTIAAGASAQTFDPLDDGSFVFNSAKVTLTFTPVSPPPGPLSAHASLIGLTLDLVETEQTFITVDVTTTPTPVPEPGSMLLIGTGVAAFVRRHVAGRARCISRHLRTSNPVSP